ncbi:fibronectin type III-like domain-contianing protein [Haloferax sp. Atlit-4N]|uniref:fibronectin type III-like domain-contianing protein n=1 Tax=Haloferax sp. Atlit-4N TaxID=2077206 RepID=UPI0018F5DDF3|nr:fibronectin type III-like domain-contianing protein [Haloferax sp. Atlit-4N]
MQELVSFERVHLEADETTQVSFAVAADQLVYHGRDVDHGVEEEPYEFRIGHLAADITSTAPLTITRRKKCRRTVGPTSAKQPSLHG